MSDTLKRQLITGLRTFISTVLTVLSIQTAGGMPIEWTSTFLFGLLITGVNAALKAMWESADVKL